MDVLLQICHDIKDSKAILQNDGTGLSPGEKIVNCLVKPLTKTDKCSYAEYIWKSPSKKHLVGKCTTFVSHPWSCDFTDTVAAICEYEKELPKDSPPQFYFVDYFAVNQHSATDDLSKLGALVQLCERLVLMGKPWNRPVTLTRVWCIFELAHAVLGDTEVVIILPPEGKIQFEKKIMEMGDEQNFVSELFHIDSANAKATKESDTTSIKCFIKQELGGFSKVDTMVADKLRSWFIRSVRSFLKRFPAADQGSMKHAMLLLQCGRFFTIQGLYSEAVLLYQEAGSIAKKNNNDVIYMSCWYNQILDLQRDGRLKDALSQAKDYIQYWGPDNERTLDMKATLGSLYRDVGRLKDSEEILRTTVEAFRKVEKPMSQNIRIWLEGLACTLRVAGKLEEAANILDEVVKYKRKAFGSSNGTTMWSVSTYARCIALMGNQQKAIQLYEEALPVLRLKYGPNDVDVKNCIKWLKEAQDQLKPD